MIAEGLFAIAMTVAQPEFQSVEPAVRYYYRRRFKRPKRFKAPPAIAQPIEDQGPRLVRSRICYNESCATFEEMWTDRILRRESNK